MKSHKDLGIIISHELKSSIQRSTAAQKASKTYGMIAIIIKNMYETRLTELDLFSLEKRRLRCDMIETFKILNDYDEINKRVLFQMNTTQSAKNHGWKLGGKKFTTGNRARWLSWLRREIRH